MTSTRILTLQLLFLTLTVTTLVHGANSHYGTPPNASSMHYLFQHGKKNFESCIADSECAGARFCTAYIKQKVEPCKSSTNCFCLPKNAQMLDCTMYNKCDEGEHCFLGRCISDKSPMSKNQETKSDKQYTPTPKPTPKHGNDHGNKGKGKHSQVNNSTNATDLLTGESCRRSTQCKQPRECVYPQNATKCEGPACV